MPLTFYDLRQNGEQGDTLIITGINTPHHALLNKGVTTFTVSQRVGYLPKKNKRLIIGAIT